MAAALPAPKEAAAKADSGRAASGEEHKTDEPKNGNGKPSLFKSAMSIFGNKNK